MKSNLFQTLQIILKSVYSTLKMSIEAIKLASQDKITREWVDQRVVQWVHEIISHVKAKWTVINPNHIEPIKGQATIIMCNHSSLYDIPFSYLAFPGHSIRMLAKKEMRKIPFMGKSMEAAGFPFVNRHNRAQAIQDMNQVRELLSDNVVMWMAPEGTRSADGRLRPFKKGGFITAIQAQATIIPLVIRGANQILPARTLNFSIGQQVDIIVGQPIDASEYHMEQKDELIRIVHHSMQSLLDHKEEK